MKKTIRRVLSLLLAVSIIACSGMCAFAYGNSETKNISLPGFTVGKTTSTATYRLQTSKSPATVNMTHLYVYTGDALGRDFTSDDNRKMNVDLYEDDVVGDEHISIYQGSYTGKKVTKFDWIRFESSGNIETDNEVELYFDFVVGKRSGDANNATQGSGHVQFNIWVD